MDLGWMPVDIAIYDRSWCLGFGMARRVEGIEYASQLGGDERIVLCE